jgi:hypothetical protein
MLFLYGLALYTVASIEVFYFPGRLPELKVEALDLRGVFFYLSLGFFERSVAGVARQVESFDGFGFFGGFSRFI